MNDWLTSGDMAQAVVLMLLAINCSMVGVWLVLRKMTMLANSVSHTVLLGIVGAYILHQFFGGVGPPAFLWLMLSSAVVAAFTMLATQFFHTRVGLQEDASIGLVFSGLFALGILWLSWIFPHSHIGLELIMGHADAIVWSDVQIVSLSFVINLVILRLLYKEYQISTFDRSLGALMGFCPRLLDFFLMTQLTLTIMVGFRSVGPFLVLAFLVGPVLCARALTHDLRKLICLAGIIGACSSLASVVMARAALQFAGLALSTPGLTCSLLLALFIALHLLQQVKQVCQQRRYK